jgi:UDP-N-acetylmuramyl tripeptide synthase
VEHWRGWAGGFVHHLGLNGQKAVRALETTIGPWQGRFDQLAVFLDAFTDTYAHTGVQAVARRLVERAAAEI